MFPKYLQQQKTIAIVGGGASGTLTAYQLIRKHAKAQVVIIDPRPALGLGLAYSTASARHLLNVPAAKISALPSDPDHFLNWLRKNHDPNADAATFAPRAVFGCYLSSLIAELRGLKQRRAEAVDCRPVNSGAVVLLDDGRRLVADLVVVATGNFAPAELSGVSDEVQHSGAYQHNAWRADAFDGLASDAPVTLIGTGLTAVDVILRLRELGHRGTITAVSRHGVLPYRHASYTPIRRSVIPTKTQPTCAAYLRELREAIHSATEWRAAVDSLRATTNALWLALPLAEQKRFRRHLQRRWDVVRHRMAPLIADSIEEELAAGALFIRDGHLVRVDVCDGAAVVTVRNRATVERHITARVINCTGPNMNYRSVQSRFVQSLFTQGLAAAGPLGGGFHCSPSGALIDRHGRESKLLFNVGPGRSGTLLESIAIPEIRQQAAELAGVLIDQIGESQAGSPVIVSAEEQVKTASD